MATMMRFRNVNTGSIVEVEIDDEAKTARGRSLEPGVDSETVAWTPLSIQSAHLLVGIYAKETAQGFYTTEF